MRVLGIDPGSVTTGWGVVEQNHHQHLTHIAHGCLRTLANAPLPEKLGFLFRGMSDIIHRYQPDSAVVEMVFVSQNVQSALKLGQARGALIAALGHAGLPIHEYTAVEVKKAVVGFGKAEKHQVQEMIRILLNLPRVPPQDAADALAGAICHLNQTQWSASANLAPIPANATTGAGRPIRHAPGLGRPDNGGGNP